MCSRDGLFGALLTCAILMLFVVVQLCYLQVLLDIVGEVKDVQGLLWPSRCCYDRGSRKREHRTDDSRGVPMSHPSLFFNFFFYSFLPLPHKFTNAHSTVHTCACAHVYVITRYVVAGCICIYILRGIFPLISPPAPLHPLHPASRRC